MFNPTPQAVNSFLDSPERELIDNPIVKGLSDSHKYLLKFYANYLRLISFVPTSRDKYTTDIARFLGWLDSQLIHDVTQITAQTIRDYERVLLSRKRQGTHDLLHARTRCVLVAVMRHFLTFLFKKEILSTNYSHFIDMPRTQTVFIRDTISEADIQTMINLPTQNNPRRIRNKALLEVLYSTGIRNSELRDLKIQDINFKENQLIIRHGKGDKPRMLPIGQKATNAIEYYLFMARRQLLKDVESDYVFISCQNQGKQLSRWQIPSIIQSIAKEAGLTQYVTTHMLRHSFATHMLNNDCDLRYIQTFLGHSRITTTEIYTHSSIEKLKAIHKKTHPLEKNA